MPGPRVVVLRAVAVPGPRVVVLRAVALPGPRVVVLRAVAVPGPRVVVLRAVAVPGPRVVVLRAVALPGPRVVVLRAVAVPGPRVVVLRATAAPGPRVVAPRTPSPRTGAAAVAAAVPKARVLGGQGLRTRARSSRTPRVKSSRRTRAAARVGEDRSFGAAGAADGAVAGGPLLTSPKEMPATGPEAPRVVRVAASGPIVRSSRSSTMQSNLMRRRSNSGAAKPARGRRSAAT